VFAENRLTGVIIPGSVTVIGEAAFTENQLINVTISDGVTVIDKAAFADNRLTGITIPDSVTSIGAGAFCMNDIAELTIPRGISSIEKGVFAANSLVSVTIPNNVTVIEASAFAYNDALARINIGPNVTIAQNAFENGFAGYYEENESKAGTYILDNGSWMPESRPEDGQAAAQPRKLREVIIDAGHGGKDNGATATHTINGKQIVLKEKEISLSIAIALKEKLLLAFPDTKISLTREDDTYISLGERMEPLNFRELPPNETALYISIHTNWSPDTNFRGYRFFVNERRPKNDESFQLAAMLGMEFASEYKDHEIPNRGILERQFITFINPYIPVVMLEMGNINNRDDASLLCAVQGLERCATALVKGIAAYMDTL